MLLSCLVGMVVRKLVFRRDVLSGLFVSSWVRILCLSCCCLVVRVGVGGLVVFSGVRFSVMKWFWVLRVSFNVRVLLVNIVICILLCCLSC